MNLYKLHEGNPDHQPGGSFFADTHRLFDAPTLQQHLTHLARILNAQIVEVSTATFEPFGSSAAMLVGQLDSGLAHLDKSHLAIHTYFESDKRSRWQSFRAEVEVSTCGDLPVADLVAVSRALLAPDFLTLDCRVRGLQRDSAGNLKVAVADKQLPELPGFERTNERHGPGTYYAGYALERQGPMRSESLRLLHQIQ
jgi:S-adenosylmethionine/arginine decarboxylase-like enzyme